MACLRKRRKRWSSKDACDEPAFPLLARPRRERCGALTQVKETNRACLRRAATKASRFRCHARPVRRPALRRMIMADEKRHVGAPASALNRLGACNDNGKRAVGDIDDK